MFSTILKQEPSDKVEIVAHKQTCDGCLWRKDGITCEAFPGGIPAPILLGVWDHHYHYESGPVNDNGIVFEPDTSI